MAVVRNRLKGSSIFLFLIVLSIIIGTGFFVWCAHGASTSAAEGGSGLIFITSTTTPTPKPTTYPVVKSTSQQLPIPTPTPTPKPTTYPVVKSTSQQLPIPTPTPTPKPTTYPVVKSTSQQMIIPTTTPTITGTTIAPTITPPTSPITTPTTLASTQTPQNAVPSALLSVIPDYGTAPLTVHFDGSSSIDPDGEPLEYHWDFGDGSSGEGSLIEHIYEQEGSFRVLLIVTDPQGLSDIAVKMINIRSETTGSTQNLPPQASVSAEPIEGPAPLRVSFSSAGTADPEGLPLSYLWDFGDGITSTDESPSHIYQSPGHYVATLLVTDAGGFSDIRAADIDVRDTLLGNGAPAAGQQNVNETKNVGFDIIMLILLTAFACLIAGFFIRNKQG
jgi:hypothetical protein